MFPMYIAGLTEPVFDKHEHSVQPSPNAFGLFLLLLVTMASPGLGAVVRGGA